MTEPLILTLAEAAAILRVSTRTLYRIIASGELRREGQGIRSDEIDRYLDAPERDPSYPRPGGPTSAVLYRFFDGAGRLLYIGVTGHGLSRWTHHARLKTWWRQVASATLEHFDTVDEALVAEAEAIQAEDPPHNVRGRQP